MHNGQVNSKRQVLRTIFLINYTYTPSICHAGFESGTSSMLEFAFATVSFLGDWSLFGLLVTVFLDFFDTG